MNAPTCAALRRRLGSVRELDQRVELLAEQVRGQPTDRLLDLLAELTRAAVRRDPAAIEAVLAWIVLSMAPRTPLAARERELFRRAQERNDPLLFTLLQPPFPTVVAEPPPGQVLTARDGRPLTLGERRAAARRGNRFLLDRLLADPDPDVVARVLRNPALTEREAVRIAAWRPGRPEVLVEVLRCPRWAVRPSVQAALLRNPAMPVALATRLVLLLPSPKLREVARDLEASLLVRLACRRQLETIGGRRRAPDVQ
ncbi:MAG: hypothetical protein JXB32_08515 [Deltaproteobacteria bacterium]|nr:hypothetical protein [Deltaproteobacteria bacterium]